MLVWLKDLQSNWLSWLAVALTLVVSSTSCTLALAMLVASSGAEETPPARWAARYSAWPCAWWCW